MLESVTFSSIPEKALLTRTETRDFIDTPQTRSHNMALYNTTEEGFYKPESIDFSTYFPFLALPLTAGRPILSIQEKVFEEKASFAKKIPILEVCFQIVYFLIHKILCLSILITVKKNSHKP